MCKAVLISIHPKWAGLILRGSKTMEVRKRTPIMKRQYKVYLYCTKGNEAFWMAGVKGKYPSYKMNGKIVGEATCVGTVDLQKPFLSTSRTCLTDKELNDYAGKSQKLSYMALKDPILYEEPKELSEFGLSKAPQSWCYVNDLEGEK